MEIKIKLVNRTDDDFARFLMPDGSTINFTDPEEAQDALMLYFGFTFDGCEAYFNADRDKSWEHTEYMPMFYHTNR